jgi:hypothetical protein
MGRSSGARSDPVVGDPGRQRSAVPVGPVVDPESESIGRDRRSGTPDVMDPIRPGRGSPGPGGARAIVRLQQLAGNRAISVALRANPPAEKDPRTLLDQTVIEGEIREVTSVPNVAAERSPGGGHVLKPEQPAPPLPPMPTRPVAAPVPAPPQSPGPGKAPGPGERPGPGEARSPARTVVDPPVGRPPTAGPDPAAQPGQAAHPATLVAGPQAQAAALKTPSSPDALKARLPGGPPSLDDFSADQADTRSPAEKKAQAQTEIAGLTAVGTQEKVALTTAVGGHRQTVRGYGQAQRVALKVRLAGRIAEIEARSASASSGLRMSATQEKADLRARTDQDVTAVGSASAARITQARADLAARRQTLTALAGTDRAETMAAAEAEATRAVAELESSAVACETAGEKEAARFPGDDDAQPDQRAAARRVGRESAADIRAKKAGLPGQLREQAVEHTRRATTYLDGVVADLSRAEQVMVGELQSVGERVQTAVRDGLAGAIGAVDSRLQQDLAALEAGTAAARRQVEAAAAGASAELDTGVVGAIADLDAAATAVHHEIDAGMEETTTVLSEPEQPFLPAVLEQVEVAKGSLTTTVGTARTQLETAVAGAEGRFVAVVTSFDAAAGGAVDRFGAETSRVAAAFTAAVGRVKALRTQAVADLSAGLEKQQRTTAAGVLAEADRAVDEARTQVRTMNTAARDGLRQAADRAVEEGTRPRTDDVSTRAREAAEQVDDGWLAGLGRALVQIAVGLIVVVVVALIVAAVAAAFGVVLTAWTAVMVAGALLLAVGLVYSLVQRLRQPELQGSPGTAILLALSDTVGATGIIEGIRGRELVTDRPLSAGERTERGVLGAVTLVSIVFGVRSAVKGPPGGAFVRPTELPVGWRGVLPRMWKGTSVAAVELWNGLAAGVRSAREWLSSRKPAAEAGPEAGPEGGTTTSSEPAPVQEPAPVPEPDPAPAPAGPEPQPAPPSRELGLRQPAVDAIRRLENLKADPVGEVNSQAKHNHYAAARREAAGEVVARRPDGRPFSHISDLQQACDGLRNVQRALDAEVRNPPDTMTERGLDVLLERQREVNVLINRLQGFLNSIGQGSYQPYHQWPPGS